MQVAANTPGISAEAAAAACSAAVAHAETNGWKINVAVVDRGGNLMAFLRMPGAFLHSIDIAIDKAYTSASFGFPTKAWMSVIGQDEGMKFGFSSQPRLIVFGGGVPIGEGEWMGGIGVSGASEAQDEECARAGLAAIGLV
ncbi:GlcG/HbpS family heme-binding protein [Propionivibrio sp.]|uniref:GlcG/HbpS family heme-binding protein n=1 Tax=Propionivibrio sp. TaxID=2212460 RepID=UPI003BF08E4E